MPSEWVVVRLRVAEKQRFIADMRAAGYATSGMGKQVERTGNLMRTGAHHGFLWNQMIFTLRRSVYHLTQALGLMAGAVIFVGFKFNSMIEQQTIAFTAMLKNSALARKEVNFLFQTAAHGPFRFQGIIMAARQLLAFNMPLKDVNKTVLALQDAMAGMGLDEAKISRATLALGEINSQGRLMGRQLRMLEIIGLVNPKDLSKRLGMSEQQLANPGRFFIPAKTAIDAITAYWQVKFGGAAKKYQASWVGLTSTMKDEFSATAGLLVKPLQDRIRKNVLPEINRVATAMQEAFQKGGFWAGMKALDKGIGHGSNITGSLKGAAFFMHEFWSITVLLTRDFVGLLMFFRIGAKFLYAIGAALAVVNWVLHKLNFAVQILLGLLIIDRSLAIAVGVATRFMAFWDGVAALTKKRLMWYTRGETGSLVLNNAVKRVAVLWSLRNVTAGNLETVMYNRKIKATKMNIFMLNLFKRASAIAAVWTAIMTGALQAAAVAAWEFTTAMLANPITWIVIAVIALIAGLVLLYYKWKWFHNAVNAAAPVIKAALEIAFAPLFLAVKAVQFLAKAFGWFGGGSGTGSTPAIANPKTAGNTFFKKNDNFTRPFFPNAGKPLPGSIMPGLAGGGTTTSSGWSVVGEKGPELRWMPRGASVIPNTASKQLASLGNLVAGVQGQALRIEVPVYLNRTKIAEAVAEGTMQRLARA